MTEKELRRLSRIELLQMFLELTEESDRQLQELNNMRQQLAACEMAAQEKCAGEMALLQRELADAKQQLAECRDAENKSLAQETDRLHLLLDTMKQQFDNTQADWQEQARAEAVRMQEQLHTAEGKLADAGEELETAQCQLRETENKLAETEHRLAETENRLAMAEAQLNERNITIQNVGSVADAAVQISDVLGAAQTAADTYLENAKRVYTEAMQKQYQNSLSKIQSMEQRTRQKCLMLLKEAQRRANSLYSADSSQTGQNEQRQEGEIHVG